jgi:uncharacterized protein YqjF (DUF2071 family)
VTDAVDPFLTARWVDLALVTYRIPAELLRPHLAPGLEPDRLEGDADDVAYVSLVGFRFLDTRVKGVAIPLHRDFPEINLRAYVRAGARRGVTFIAELVPKPAIAVVANLLYHEHYRAVPMTMQAEDVTGGSRRVEYTVELADRVHRIALVGRRPTEHPPESSLEHFFKEHEWGFGTSGDGELVVYRVHHPIWDVHPTGPDLLELDWGFGELYGPPWHELDGRQPFHVALAVGSEIAVFPRER